MIPPVPSARLRAGCGKRSLRLKIDTAIESLRDSVQNPSEGLPEKLFLFVSGITPLVNVDLLIKDGDGRTLLTWRDDGLYAPGWHIPGGIIRFKESMYDRIGAVASGELGAEVEFDPAPLAVNEVIHPARTVRGHFVSLLFACRLTGPLDGGIKHTGGVPRPGQWAWHAGCPDNLISVHEMYRKFF